MDVRVHELQLTRARAEQLMDRQRKANAVANMQRRRAPELAYLEERRRQTIDFATLTIAGLSLLTVAVIVGRVYAMWMYAIACVGVVVCGFALISAVLLLLRGAVVNRAVIELSKAAVLARSRVGDDPDRAGQSQNAADTVRALFTGQAATEQEVEPCTKNYALNRRLEQNERAALEQLGRQADDAAREYQSVVGQVATLRGDTESSHAQELDLERQNKLFEAFVNEHGW